MLCVKMLLSPRTLQLESCFMLEDALVITVDALLAFRRADPVVLLGQLTVDTAVRLTLPACRPPRRMTGPGSVEPVGPVHRVFEKKIK